MYRSKKIVLENGHSVVKPFNWTPFIILGVLLIIWFSSTLTDFEPSVLFIEAPTKFVQFIDRLFPYDNNYFSRIWVPIIETLAMSFIGTLLGTILAFPTMYFASSNLNQNKLSLNIIRVVLGIVRTIPLTVYAILLSIVFGLGSFVGMLAIGIFTYSILTKMMYDYIETVNMSPFEALLATGSSRFKAYWVAIMPQISGVFLSQILYNFEMNIRSSAILGYVGAGGIGLMLNYQIGLQNYSNVTPILIVIFMTVLVVEFASRALRKRLS